MGNSSCIRELTDVSKGQPGCPGLLGNLFANYRVWRALSPKVAIDIVSSGTGLASRCTVESSQSSRVLRGVTTADELPTAPSSRTRYSEASRHIVFDRAPWGAKRVAADADTPRGCDVHLMKIYELNSPMSGFMVDGRATDWSRSDHVGTTVLRWSAIALRQNNFRRRGGGGSQ